MFDTYELQDPWLKGEFEKAFAAGFARGEATGLRTLLQDLLTSCAIEPNDEALESADAPQLHAWAIDMFRGTFPDAISKR